MIKYSFDNYGISVRTGKIVPRHVITHQDIINNNPTQWKELCIEGILYVHYSNTHLI